MCFLIWVMHIKLTSSVGKLAGWQVGRLERNTARDLTEPPLPPLKSWGIQSFKVPLKKGDARGISRIEFHAWEQYWVRTLEGENDNPLGASRSKNVP